MLMLMLMSKCEPALKVGTHDATSRRDQSHLSPPPGICRFFPKNANARGLAGGGGERGGIGTAGID